MVDYHRSFLHHLPRLARSLRAPSRTCVQFGLILSVLLGSITTTHGQQSELPPVASEEAATDESLSETVPGATTSSEEAAAADTESESNSDGPQQQVLPQDAGESQTSEVDEAVDELDPYAELPGQADLDKATVLKLNASSMGDLETVVDLCRQAIKSGLDDGSEAYARELMASTLFEQASRLSRLIFDQQPPDRRWPRIRQICLEKAQASLEVDEKNGMAHLLIARLNGLPGGDRELALNSVKKSITLLEDPQDLSQAYQIRAGFAEDPADRLADLNQSIQLAPANQAAWRARGLHYLAIGETDKALDDLEHLLEENPNDLIAHQAIAQTLSRMEKYDEAMDHLNQVIDRNDEAVLAYNLRARVREQQGDVQGAVTDLNRVVQLQPRDIGAILSRARLRLGQQQFDLARSDITRVLQLRPGLPQAILMRSLLSAAQGRTSEAVDDLRLLIKQDPDNAELKIQLATFYEFDQRPRRAIKLYDNILQQMPDNLAALRRRGDALLSIGRHQDAIRDYERVLELEPQDHGVLNNLAWVLCTSPKEEVRDGKKAIELATKACEATSYEAPHIISTLAASYAETGNFEKAIEWSEKAVAMESNQHDQLAKELEAYREGKPWREIQELEENPNPLGGEGDELPDFELAEDPEPALEADPDESPSVEDAPSTNDLPNGSAENSGSSEAADDPDDS